MVLRVVAGAIVVAAVVALVIWLNLPRSVPLFVQGIGQARNPVDFDFQFVGMPPGVSRIPVELYYFPQTPISGITLHYWSIIAPPRIDTIQRTLEVEVAGGRARWQAPLALAGLSNYRLRSVWFDAQGSPYRLTMAETPDRSKAPRNLDIPSIAVSDGAYRFDGALALWRRLGDDENAYAYAPRVDDIDAPLFWDGLRSVSARVDLAPYPIASFVVPQEWEGAGWHNQGYQRSRSHATVTDKALELDAGVSVPLPFARECASPPQFAIVAANATPPWSHIYGLWRPLARTTWEAFARQSPPPPDLSVRFGPAAGGAPSLDRVEFFDVLGRAAGTFRLFAACPNPHYGSVGVTWIDITVKAPLTHR
jgi:hypothetical protein